MTVEASLLLPLFIMLFMNLLSVIEVYRIHSSVAISLWERGREEAVKEAAEAFLRKQAEDSPGVSEERTVERLQAILGSFGDRNRIVKNLETYPVWKRIVAGQRAGFSVSEKTEDDGTIRIDCSYRIHPLFTALTPVGKTLENHYYGHAWVGYVHSGETDEQGEIYVYITETGSVYHKNRGCSYLNPSIRQVQAGEIENLRNTGGAVYYGCSLCHISGGERMYYVTDYGTSYHTNITCSGLKRTIYEVKMNETGGRSACSKCGG